MTVFVSSSVGNFLWLLLFLSLAAPYGAAWWRRRSLAKKGG